MEEDHAHGERRLTEEVGTHEKKSILRQEKTCGVISIISSIYFFNNNTNFDPPSSTKAAY